MKEIIKEAYLFVARELRGKDATVSLTVNLEKIIPDFRPLRMDTMEAERVFIDEVDKVVLNNFNLSFRVEEGVDHEMGRHKPLWYYTAFGIHGTVAKFSPHFSFLANGPNCDHGRYSHMVPALREYDVQGVHKELARMLELIELLRRQGREQYDLFKRKL